MEAATYKRQVELLLRVLPEVSKEKCFALHGGTAINLFVRDMPRLSVDIDLTYVPIEDRSSSLKNIQAALTRIKGNIEKAIAGGRVTDDSNKGKLRVSLHGTVIKVEVNLVGRGTIANPTEMPLCRRAQDEFDAYAAMQIVPMAQLYGGKICAALDRQHPRDLFDVRHLLDNEGFPAEVKKGFLLALLSHDRPIRELLEGNSLDQKATLENQFIGMTAEEFTYEIFEETRVRLIDTIWENLTKADKDFILSVKRLEPDWQVYDFERFPAVQWKLQNLRYLKENNLEKFRQLNGLLEVSLNRRI